MKARNKSSDIENKNTYHPLKRIASVIGLQLKEGLGSGRKKEKKDVIRFWVFFVLKFLVVTGAIVAVLTILNAIGIIVLKSDLINYYTIILMIILVLSCISCMMRLSKTLYYSDDNKVLITFPISSSGLFISKLVVFFVDELRKCVDMIVPLTLAFLICAVGNKITTFAVLIWAWFPLLFAIVIIILLAALLSVPYYYVLRFLRKYALVELLLIVALITVLVVGVVLLIGLIPDNLDLIGKWPSYQRELQNFVRTFATNLGPVRLLVNSMFGNVTSANVRAIDFNAFVIMISTLGIAAVLFAIVYFVIKPFYLSMMTKSFEFDKSIIERDKPNHVHKRYITFANKELKLSFRDIEISGSYLSVYIIVPILLYFLDTLFAAMTTKLEGDIMTYAFNILLILVPLLASNSMIATMFSKEGRAAYIKKTKPINPLLPLISKLLFNLVLSLPCVIACAVVFGNFAHFNVGIIIMIIFILLFLQYGHIVYSATLDIMHPQNEKYATGETFTSPNETNSTVVSFIISFLFSLVAYFFFNESITQFDSNFTVAFVKLFLISAALFGSFTLLFVLKVKAYYYAER